MNTRREVLKRGLGLAAIIAAGKAPAAVVRSMCAARGMSVFCGGKEKLPYDAEVEYLESDGGQYIDTGVYLTGTDDVEVGFRKVTNNDSAIFGGRTAYTHAQYMFRTMPSACSFYYQDRGGVEKSIVFDSKEDYVLNIANGYTYLNQEQTAISYNPVVPFTAGGPCYLFACSNYISESFKGRIHFFKINSGIGINLIPVRFTNELGEAEGAMYDKVSKKLFRNQGTGSFKFGRDIKPISARSYVNDGLIAMWDGIENAGFGTHDASVATWKDLVGEYDITLNQGHYLWGKDSISTVDDVSTTPTSSNIIGYRDNCSGLYSSMVSMEAVIQANSDCIGDYVRVAISMANPTYSLRIFGFRCGTELHPSARSRSNPYKNNIQTGVRYQAYASYMSNDEYVSKFFFCGNQVTTPTISVFTSNYPLRRNSIVIGGYDEYARSRFSGSIMSIRCYSRELTADEISANYAVDKIRFNLP